MSGKFPGNRDVTPVGVRVQNLSANIASVSNSNPNGNVTRRVVEMSRGNLMAENVMYVVRKASK